MVDSVISVTAMLGSDRIPVVVTEKGWVSHCGEDERTLQKIKPICTIQYIISEASADGTWDSIMKGGVIEIDIYELFDEDGKKKEEDDRLDGFVQQLYRGTNDCF
ncbi:hypothetical protein NE237_017282 [Protea cynaroides]|uniref:Uncharacterized protein n=1 Tax=Protea cynaroides TaxID=273540 RepID=A0A9Q0K7Q6_9MAGN|nr:hypothetical protein NE237_017282 [Protea cynaroides]